MNLYTRSFQQIKEGLSEAKKDVLHALNEYQRSKESALVLFPNRVVEIEKEFKSITFKEEPPK